MDIYYIETREEKKRGTHVIYIYIMYVCGDQGVDGNFGFVYAVFVFVRPQCSFSPSPPFFNFFFFFIYLFSFCHYRGRARARAQYLYYIICTHAQARITHTREYAPSSSTCTSLVVRYKYARYVLYYLCTYCFAALSQIRLPKYFRAVFSNARERVFSKQSRWQRQRNENKLFAVWAHDFEK